MYIIFTRKVLTNTHFGYIMQLCDTHNENLIREVSIIAQLFYPNIEAERAKAQISQDELAEMLNVERKSYYNWQNNGKIPVKVLCDLADLFRCSTDYLLGRSESREAK